jgi:catechol 2,3-dioxygenase-like lactoylglutathione lyase family enzyme
MPYHHLAVATHDMPSIDVFYTQAMGFDLVKVELAKTPTGGWAKHFFYDTGEGEMMAFWELHDDSMPAEFPTGLSTGVGLPEWVNHIAFKADDAADLEKRKQRLLDHGYDVLEIDHNWCYSIYTADPNGTMVEFCRTTGEFDDADRAKARAALTSDDFEFEESKPNIEFHKAEKKPAHLAAGSAS